MRVFDEHEVLVQVSHAEFPYHHLVKENQRTKLQREYELIDTGIFDGGRYFDVEVEYGKIAAEDLLIREDCEKVVAAARHGGRDKVSCIILGRREDDSKVHEWLTTAADVPRFIGFAVGRTSFWDPLVEWRAKRATPELAALRVAPPLPGIRKHV